MKLLFIEDYNIIRESFRDYINTLFNDVYEVVDGKNAFDTYLKVKPDIILLDINLPSINGIDIAKKIRKSDSKIIIIVLSAQEDRDTLIEATTLNLTKYLLKPISRKEFKKTMTETISKINEKNREKEVIRLTNGFVWNKKEKVLFHNGENIELTKNELLLLDNFCVKSNRVVTFEDIYFHIYSDLDYNENKLRMLIKRFRIKTHQDILLNIYGLGYKFNII